MVSWNQNGEQQRVVLHNFSIGAFSHLRTLGVFVVLVSPAGWVVMLCFTLPYPIEVILGAFSRQVQMSGTRQRIIRRKK